MSCKSDICFTGAIALPLCLMLAACGGDGATNVASIPSPPPAPITTPTPTPTPTPAPTFVTKQSVLASPATRPGTYDVIGLFRANGSVSSRLVRPGEFTMNAGRYFSDDPLQYYLIGPAGVFPAGATPVGTDKATFGLDQAFQSWTFRLPPATSMSFSNEPLGSWCCQYLGDHLTVSSKAADGTETEILSTDMTRASSSPHFGPKNNVGADLAYDIGYSYVAMGEWSWGAVGGSSDLLFVEGNLTLPSGIPASGTATYDARGLNFVNGPFALTADFGQRTMAAVINQDYRYQPNGDLMDYPLAFGIHVSGSAPFSNDGLFNIPLTGTANWASSYAINTSVAPPPESVTGSMNGAFFGPNAEQVGGTFFLNRSSGAQLMEDAFVGQRRP